MSEPVVAPYGGLLVKTIADEQEREAKIQEQLIEVEVDGKTEIIRPDALYMRGVDNLSTDDIKCFVDYYININVIAGEDKITYEQNEEQVGFKVEWINDTSVNVVFSTHNELLSSLSKLSDDVNFISKPLPEYISEIIKLRSSKPYSPSINYKNQQNLLKRLDVSNEKSNENSEMEEDDSDLIIQIRQSFQSDKKVKNAKEFSRYYLLHGEPDRRFEKRRFHMNNDRSYERKRSARRQSEEDLFANKLQQVGKTDLDDEEDLFADRLRERSPTRGPNPNNNGKWRDRR